MSDWLLPDDPFDITPWVDLIHIGLVRGCHQCLAGLSEAEHEEEFYASA